MHLSYYSRPIVVFIFIYIVFIYLLTPLIIREKPLIGNEFCGYSLSYIFEGKNDYYFYFKTQDQNVIVRIYQKIQLSLFDEICIKGNYKRISSNDYFGNFSWKRYMNFKNIFWEIEANELEFKKSWPFFAKLSELRYKFLNSIEENLSKSSYAIVAGLVFGEKRGLSKDFREAAIKCGIMHLMVASGSNISYFVLILAHIFGFLGIRKKISYIYAMIISFFYVVLIGFEPPITRAYLMILLLYIFYFIKKNIDPLQILFGVLAFFILVKPILLYDPSFIMSFLCVYGIIVGILNWGEFRNVKIFSFNSHDTKGIIFLKKTINTLVSFMLSIFFITFFSQLSLFVYISTHFYRFSLISLVSNIILVPFSTLIITSSLITFILLIFIKFNTFFILEFLVDIFAKLVYFFSSFKYSSFLFSSYSLFNSFSILLTVFVLLHFKSLNFKYISTRIFLAFVVLFLFFSFLWKDVVKQDICFSLRENKKAWYIQRNDNFYLIDPIVDVDKIINAVYASRRNKIDYILVSSYDAMRMNNIEKLREIFNIKKIYVPIWLCAKDNKFECVFGGDKGDGFDVVFKDKYGYFNVYSKLLFCFDERCF